MKILFVCLLIQAGCIAAIHGMFGLHCWRDDPRMKLSFGQAISEIRRYIDSSHGLRPGAVLAAVSGAIWPEDVPQLNMYCFDEEIHGNVPAAARKKFEGLLEGFRPHVSDIINSTVHNPESGKLRKPLLDLHVNVSFYFKDFLQVVEIEKSSLYIREYSMLLLGLHAEIVNFDRASRKFVEVDRRLQLVAGDCYALSKFTYWFNR